MFRQFLRGGAASDHAACRDRRSPSLPGRPGGRLSAGSETRAERSASRYFTSSTRLSEWLLNSGAYMHWMAAKPVWYVPASCTRTAYSKTYVPLGK